MQYINLLQNFNSAYFILGPNNLTVIKRATCYKKSTIYNQGELERIDFTYRKGGEDEAANCYVLQVITKSGKVDTIFNERTSLVLFTLDEIEFFSNVVNNHIQTKMKV